MQLCEILRAKAVEPLIVPESRQGSTLPPPPDAPPAFPEFKPSEQLERLEWKLGGLQFELSRKRADPSATERSIWELMHKIQYLTDELTTLGRSEKRSYQEEMLAYYKLYAEEVDKWWDFFNEEVAERTKGGDRINYSTIKDDWCVVSGTDSLGFEFIRSGLFFRIKVQECPGTLLLISFTRHPNGTSMILL